jgi:peptidoglycan/xylan/chitin deacetylase (PgdA/CDA1 family)
MGNDATRKKKVPMLLYHALVTGEDNAENYAITRSEFERHIRYLSDHGFESLTCDDVMNGGTLDPGKKYVLITFDDGNISDYLNALPVLLRYGFVATFFVTVNRIGTDQYVDWPHLMDMREKGMSIQSHSMNHVFLSDLDANLLQREIAGSKKVLEEMLSLSVQYLSLPGGFTSRRVLRAVREAGYAGVVTSSPGYNSVGGRRGRPFAFRRFAVTRKTTMDELRKIVNGDSLTGAAHRLLYITKSLAKKVLGSRSYYRIWSKYFKYEK